MKYFDINTIKNSIRGLQNINPNWLIPAFVFAANDVGTDLLVDLSKNKGTDQFLDRYFNGSRLGIPAFPTGNNLLRPRLKGLRWDRGEFADDYVLRNDSKLWGNLFSSRGYREMRLQGFIEGDQGINRLTDSFQGRFESEIQNDFCFENFLVWLFAFEGVPDEIDSWDKLFQHFLNTHLGLVEFKAPYKGRFKLSEPVVPWPTLLELRPTNEDFMQELAPKLAQFLASDAQQTQREELPGHESELPPIGRDDEVYASMHAAISSHMSLAFLIAGPPGTGKTRYARRLALKIAEGDESRILFLQFHPAVGYDDFIEGFRPSSAEESAVGIKYELAPRLFLKFAQTASGNAGKFFVAVIDELNRGDVARIFGEVLTYLEPAYRKKEFTLPYSGNRVSLPENLILIATANPYDRSITELDDALLRRFWVFELEPDAVILKSHLQSMGVEENVLNRTVHLFKLVNEKMPHGFGHTSFLDVRSIEDLATVWVGRIRMSLKRALMHDRHELEAVIAQIESLLSTRDYDGDGVASADTAG